MTWSLLRVEFAVCGWILIMLFADLFAPARRRSALWLLALGGVTVALGLLATTPLDLVGETFQTMFVLDRFAIYFKGLFLFTTGVVIVMTRHLHRPATSATDQPDPAHGTGFAHPGAFYMLLLTALLGMLVLASITDFLMLFIALELLTFSLYIMAAYLRTDTRAVEAGMKYLILGSISAGFLVYGIALLYGAAGSTSFDAVRAVFANGPVPLTAQAGMLFILAALGFKIGMVPFHLWVPDVYEGAPTPVVALMSVGSKMAGVVAILRVFHGVFAPAHLLWGGLFAVLAATTMLYGNLAAIPQTNIKRLLGYSSIGHAGYLLMGLSTISVAGREAVGYYLLAYLVSNLTVFLVVAVAASHLGGDSLEGYNGLSKRSPLLAAALFIGLLSLAGVPPLAGFVGKFLVLLATMESGQVWLVAVGAVNVAISLYYYLMIVRRMYLLPPASVQPITVDAVTRITLFALIIGMIVIGVIQGPFLGQIVLAFG